MCKSVMMPMNHPASCSGLWRGACDAVEVPRTLAKNGNFREALGYYVELASKDPGRIEVEWKLQYRRGDLRAAAVALAAAAGARSRATARPIKDVIAAEL